MLRNATSCSMPARRRRTFEAMTSRVILRSVIAAGSSITRPGQPTLPNTDSSGENGALSSALSSVTSDAILNSHHEIRAALSVAIAELRRLQSGRADLPLIAKLVEVLESSRSAAAEFREQSVDEVLAHRRA